MEEPLSFVRDNPFVKNDGCRRLFRRNPLVQKEIAAQESPSVSDQLGYSIKKVMVIEKEADDQQDHISTESSSDIEYGPGIVEKLKAKFYQLSGIASREAKVSPHATGKRCPSVDDILSATEQPSPTWENQPNVANSLHKAYSKSMGDVFDSTPEKRSFVVHRAARIGDEDEEDELQPISVLRKKFEQNVQRRPSQNRRNSQGFTTKLAHRPKSVDFSEHDSMLRNLSTPRSFTVLQSSESCSCQIPVSSCRQESVDSYRALPKITSPLFSSIQDKDSCHSTGVLDENSQTTIRKDVSHLRVLEVLNHREPDDEPEFVKIGRRLKRSPLHLDDMPETIELKKDIIENNSFVSPRSETSAEHGVVYRSYNPTMRTAQSQQIEHDYTEETRKYIVRASPDVPIITSNTKIVRESENSRAFETYSPPDPQPANSLSSDIVIMASPAVRYSSDSSPPPEEPKPRMKADNSPVIEKFSTPQHFNKSDNRATVQEMLHRFQKNRDSRMIDFGGHNKDEFVQDSSERVPAAVAFRMTDEPKTQGALPYNYAVPNSKCNVISISVSPNSDEVSLCSSSTSSSMARRSPDEEDSGISPISATSKKVSTSTSSFDVAPAVPMTPPPSSPHYATTTISNNVYNTSDSLINSTTDRPSSLSSQETLEDRVSRKSLSARYLEEKLQKFHVLNEKPYGDDATELKTELKESSIDEDVVELTYKPTISIPLGDSATELHNISQDDESSRIMNLKNDLYDFEHSLQPQRAGDGNFVRQHLISIVMEEDIPCILEAMREKYNFEFEDLQETSSSTSSIIHPTDRRQQRRKERKVSGISFEQKTPVVYTYLDENSAISSQEWQSGTELDYYDYQRLFDPAFEEYERKLHGQFSLTSKSLSSALVDDFFEGDVSDYTLENELIQTSSNENTTIFV